MKNKILSFFLALSFIFSLAFTVTAKELKAGDEVLIGGMPFGIKIYTGEMTVSGFTDVDGENGSYSPAFKAGMRENDIILKLNNADIHSADEITNAVEKSGGKTLNFECRRGNKKINFAVTPLKSKSSNQYRIGVWIKDCTTGIGTVTYIDKDSGRFGGLGHGICSAESGNLLPLKNGIVNDVTISGINRGEPGAPGELKGFFSSSENGVIQKNTKCGLFGMLSNINSGNKYNKPIKIACKDETISGNAKIYCTLSENKICEYDIDIICDTTDKNSSNFSIIVTDSDLINETGGIVQGMSGSPIIQNGKLVGAVTHVLVNDPTRGYGIFIENMLNAAS